MNLGKEQMNLGRTSTKREEHKNKSRKHKKEAVRNEEYINGNIEYITGNQQQHRRNRGSNQRFGRKGSRKYPVRTVKRSKKNKASISSLWDSFKCTNICILGVLEEEREQGIENPHEKIMTENFPNLVQEIDIQVQEAQRDLNKRNPKKSTPRHIIIKLPKVKDKES